MEKPAIPGRFSALNWPRRLLSREVMAEGKDLKSNGLLCGAPYSISLSARQVHPLKQCWLCQASNSGAGRKAGGNGHSISEPCSS